MEELTAIEPIGRVFKPRGGESRQFIEDGGKTRIEVPAGPVQVVGTYTGNEQFGLFVWRGDGYIRLAKSPENTRGGGSGIQRPIFATFGAQEGDEVYLYLLEAAPAGYEKHTGSISVVPLGS